MLAFAALTMTSCKKDYTCECKLTMFGETSTSTTLYKNVKKKDAESACNSLNTQASAFGSCALK